MKLIVPKSMIADIVEQALAEKPNECCGLLSGLRVGNDWIAEARYPLTNAARSPVRFDADVRELFLAHKAIRAAGREIVAVYHSHPTSEPKPSRTDIAEHMDPNVACLIVGLANEPICRAWLPQVDHRGSIVGFASVEYELLDSFTEANAR
jgi:[CysO sulfur-carrier protein]-S-L-cysteine hydrolase